MNTDKFLHIHTEDEIKSFGVKGYFELREKSSKEGDVMTLLDIAIYRFLHGSNATYIDLLPELFYLFGKTNRIEELNDLLNENNWAPMMLPQSCIMRAQNMLVLGAKFPYYSEKELQYLENIWCESNSYEWMDIIMYDSYLLPRTLKKFDKESLNKVHTDFSDDFLLLIYDYFKINEDNEKERFCYDRKTNNIIKKEYIKLGRGEYIIANSKRYYLVNKYLTKTFGEECANYFARELMFIEEDIEKFKSSEYCSVNPYQVVNVAEKYFEDSIEVLNIKKWFANDFLYRCNHPKD